jgi:hypothetical protein
MIFHGYTFFQTVFLIDRNKYNSLRRQTSTPRTTFCGQDSLDVQDGVSYTSPHKKEGLIKAEKEERL